MRSSSAASLLLLAACAAEPSASEPPTQRPVVSLPAADRAKPAECKDEWVAASTGRVVVDDGSSLVGAQVGYCTYTRESAICLPFATTEAGGWYALVVEERHRCLQGLSIRVVPPEGRLLSETFCALPPRAQEGVLDLEPPLRVYSLEAPAEIPARGDPNVTRTVRFGFGLEVSFAPDDLVEGDLYERLSAGPVTDAQPCFLPPGLAMDAMYAFGPAMNVMIFADRPKVRFALPNPKKLPEGTSVSIYVLGGTATQLDLERAIPEGSFVEIGTGHVEGDRVVPDPGSELPALTVVGYRRRGG